jgi:hypothetical protein
MVGTESASIELSQGVFMTSLANGLFRQRGPTSSALFGLSLVSGCIATQITQALDIARQIDGAEVARNDLHVKTP